MLSIRGPRSSACTCRRTRAAGKSGEELFFEIALAEITQAADLFRPTYDKTNTVDGWVSLEVSPLLAYDTAKTLAAAKDLHERADAVLADLASRAGTADGQQSGTDISGLRGFHRPGEAPRELTYGGNVQNIAWRPEFAKYGHNGGHTDVVASPFITRFVAPLVVPATAPRGSPR